MRMISTKEAALRWGVSLREVQRLLAEGRVAGATKYGNYWMIPQDCEKPADPRTAKRAKHAEAPAYRFAPVTVLMKGNADASLAGLSGNARALAAADLAYRRGDPTPAKADWRETAHTEADLVSAASLATAAAISSGDYALYYEIQCALDERMEKTTDARARALLSLPRTLAVVSMALPELTPGWLASCDFSLFPPEIKPFLLYLYAMHARNLGDRAAQLSTARAAAILTENELTFTWLDVNLLLLAASGGYALCDPALAKRYLLCAMNLGLPCGMIVPFADNLGDFGGLMEECLAAHYPAYRAPVLTQWEVSFKNWMRFHNEFSMANVTTILTPQEYHVARLLANGETYAGVSRRLNLSVGRVKNLQTAIYGKLHIVRRSELAPYIV